MTAWAFHYAGPLHEKVDLSCVTCLSKARKHCPTHATQFADGCAHCIAAKGGECQAHWGLAAALDFYEREIMPKDAAGDLRIAVGLLSADVAGVAAAAHVDVDMSGSRVVLPNGSLGGRVFAVQALVR